MITAGSELDALIAKHVMKIEPRTFADGCPICNGPLYDVGTRARCGNCGDWVYSPYLEYSADIAAAWQVVEKINAAFGNDVALCLRLVHADKWRARWGGDFRAPIYEADADTAPLAICLAALKACGMAIEDTATINFPVAGN